MKTARAVPVALLLAAGFTWGVLHLLGAQFSAGDLYPEYSSLRSDPKGCKLLFDTLSRIPGISVGRNYAPLEYLDETPGAVLLLGLGVASADRDFIQQTQTLARRGNRVVAAMAFEDNEQPADHSPLEEQWHIRLTIDPKPGNAHPLSFARADGWEIIHREGSQILAVERVFGAGRVLLLAESGAFSNSSLISGGRLEQISEALGPVMRVTFDEAHFGIAESGSVVALIRRFRLTGLVFGLAIVLALALWKNTSVFPPRGETHDPQRYTGRTSSEGLMALLQRHVRSKDLVQTCWEEWLKSNRREISPERAALASTIVSSPSSNLPQAMHEIQTALRAKGKF
jgi:hypothetical protein